MGLCAFPDAQILAFEPLVEHRDVLTRRACAEPSFQYVPAAAGACDGFAALNVAADLDGSGIYDTNENARRIDVRTIDGEVAARGLRGPFLIKLDTHGYEFPILAGASRCLAATSALIIEVYAFYLTRSSPLFHELTSRMAELGFRCSDIVGILRRPDDGVLWQADFVFQPVTASIFKKQSYR